MPAAPKVAVPAPIAAAPTPAKPSGDYLSSTSSAGPVTKRVSRKDLSPAAMSVAPSMPIPGPGDYLSAMGVATKPAPRKSPAATAPIAPGMPIPGPGDSPSSMGAATKPAARKSPAATAPIAQAMPLPGPGDYLSAMGPAVSATKPAASKAPGEYLSAFPRQFLSKSSGAAATAPAMPIEGPGDYLSGVGKPAAAKKSTDFAGRLAQLEVAKHEAVERQDFDRAKLIKQEVECLLREIEAHRMASLAAGQ